MFLDSSLTLFFFFDLCLFFFSPGPAWLGTNVGDQCVKTQGGLCVQADYTHYTIVFNAFVFCQVFNEFNARYIF